MAASVAPCCRDSSLMSLSAFEAFAIAPFLAGREPVFVVAFASSGMSVLPRQLLRCTAPSPGRLKPRGLAPARRSGVGALTLFSQTKSSQFFGEATDLSTCFSRRFDHSSSAPEKCGSEA